jgi:hypothetical protein
VLNVVISLIELNGIHGRDDYDRFVSERLCFPLQQRPKQHVRDEQHRIDQMIMSGIMTAIRANELLQCARSLFDEQLANRACPCLCEELCVV